MIKSQKQLRTNKHKFAVMKININSCMTGNEKEIGSERVFDWRLAPLTIISIHFSSMLFHSLLSVAFRIRDANICANI